MLRSFSPNGESLGVAAMISVRLRYRCRPLRLIYQVNSAGRSDRGSLWTSGVFICLRCCKKASDSLFSELKSSAKLARAISTEVGGLSRRYLAHATAVNRQNRIRQVRVIQYVRKRALNFDSDPFSNAEIFRKTSIHVDGSRAQHAAYARSSKSSDRRSVART